MTSLLSKYKDIKKLLLVDIYLVTSEEGGPRSILESMASGVLMLN